MKNISKNKRVKIFFILRSAAGLFLTIFFSGLAKQGYKYYFIRETTEIQKENIMLNLHKMPEFTFPENFIWGSGSAAHQIEGDNYNNQWYHMEQNNSNPAIKEPSGKACNSWEMLDEDIALLKELGHKGYRFSVEWSRIEPENGRFDHAALALRRHNVVNNEVVKHSSYKGISRSTLAMAAQLHDGGKQGFLKYYRDKYNIKK